jgi:WD40 repeat protein
MAGLLAMGNKRRRLPLALADIHDQNGQMNSRRSPVARLLALFLTLTVGSRAQAQEVTAVVFFPRGDALACARSDGKIRFLDAESGHEIWQAEAHPGGAYGIAMSTDGTVLASCGADKKVKLWKITGPRDRPILLKTLTGHDKDVVAVAWTPDGRIVASGGYDGIIRLWDVETGKPLAKLQGHRGRITALAFFPHDKILASAGNGKFESPLYQDDAIHLWDVPTGRLLETMPQEAHQFALTDDGRSLVAVRDYTTVIGKKQFRAKINRQANSEMSLWNVTRGFEIFKFQEDQHAMAVSPDGKWLALGWGSSLHRNYVYFSDNASKGLQLWELASGKPVLWRDARWDQATVLAFSPDGTRLAAGEKAGNVSIYPIPGQGWLPGRRLKFEQLEELWETLGQEDAAQAYEALGLFAAHGGKAVDFLENHLQTVTPVVARIPELIKDLNNENFKVRDVAYRDLLRLGSAAEMELRRVLRTKPALETERRVQKLLNVLPNKPPSSEEIRQSRAVIVLGRIGSDAARGHLEVLAEGEPSAWLTREAQSALRNLSRQKRD